MKPRTFFSTTEWVLGWVSVVLFAAAFPLFVAYLFVSPRYGLGASWKPLAEGVAGKVLLMDVGVCAAAGLVYAVRRSRSRATLVERGHLACPYCTYDLRGVKLPGVCAECGEAVGEAEGVRGHWRRQYPGAEGESAT